MDACKCQAKGNLVICGYILDRYLALKCLVPRYIRGRYIIGSDKRHHREQSD